jgi:hypothetical protein
MEKHNPFQPLADMFPDERFDEIGQLFDASADRGADGDQWKLSGLAMLLDCLEDTDEFTEQDIGIPILAKLRALQAAYWLGREWQDTPPAE